MLDEISIFVIYTCKVFSINNILTFFFLPFWDYVNDNVKYYTTFKLGDINGNF
jgi:hypothetical protein